MSLVHVTDGAPRSEGDAKRAGFADWQAYAGARRQELQAALALTGRPIATHSFAIADQGASLALVDGTARLAMLLAGMAPDLIVTHPYEGGHPDHDATAFMVHAAHKRLEGSPVPLLEMTSYHRWEGAFVAGAFLPAPAVPERRISLSAEQRTLKERMFSCFHTQAHVLAAFPIGEERFRPAPAYDFTRSPTEEMLHYEQFDWGMSGQRFRELVAAALERIDRC